MYVPARNKKISCLVGGGGPLLARRLSWDLQTPAPPLKSGSAAGRSGSKVPDSGVEPRVGGESKNQVHERERSGSRAGGRRSANEAVSESPVNEGQS